MIPPCEWPTRATGSPGSMPACAIAARMPSAYAVLAPPTAAKLVGRSRTSSSRVPRGREHVVGAGQVDHVAGAVGPADRLHLDGPVVGGVGVAGEQADLGAGGPACSARDDGHRGVAAGRAAPGRLGVATEQRRRRGRARPAAAPRPRWWGGTAARRPDPRPAGRSSRTRSRRPGRRRRWRGVPRARVLGEVLLQRVGSGRTGRPACACTGSGRREYLPYASSPASTAAGTTTGSAGARPRSPRCGRPRSPPPRRSPDHLVGRLEGADRAADQQRVGLPADRLDQDSVGAGRRPQDGGLRLGERDRRQQRGLQQVAVAHHPPPVPAQSRIRLPAAPNSTASPRTLSYPAARPCAPPRTPVIRCLAHDRTPATSRATAAPRSSGRTRRPGPSARRRG